MQKILLVICTFLVFLLFFVGFFHPITAINEDLGRHLLLGEIIAQTRTVPTTNLLSYTYPNQPFVNSHWLSEVIFYYIFLYFGFNGLLIVSVVLSFITFSTLYIYTTKRYSFATTTFASIIVLPLLIARTDIRPELFSFLFFALFLVILYTYRKRDTRWIFLLIPLELLWVNTHIYFFVGIALLSFFLIDFYLKNKKKLTPTVKKLGTVWFCSILVTFINPNGLHGALLPFTVFQNYGLPIIENQSVIVVAQHFQQTQTLYGMIIIGLLYALLILKRRHVTIIDWLLVLFFSVMALTALRNFPLFAYASLIPFTSVLSSIIPHISLWLRKHTSKTYVNILKNLLLFVLSLLLIFTLTRIITIQGFGFGIKDHAKLGVDFFVENKLAGPIFNNFNIGSYLAYRLYPKVQVFIDGRPEAYPKEFLQNVYIPMQKDTSVFLKAQYEYGFKTIILTHWDQTQEQNTVMTSLLDNPNYALIYLDDYIVIFVRNSTVSETFLLQNAIKESTFLIPKTHNDAAIERYYAFFKKANWEKQLQEISSRRKNTHSAHTLP